MRIQAFFLLSILLTGMIAAGCSGDHDPQEKINEPGYYNGPLKGKGGAAGGAMTGGKATGD